MAGRGDRVTLEEERERARNLLAERYAEGILDLDAYEARIDAVERATELATIESTTVDLRPEAPAPEISTALVRRVGSMEIVPRDQVQRRGRVLSVLGGASRKGSWDVPRRLQVIAVLGSVKLDLREARLAEGVTEIRVFAMLGEVEITAPPGLRVVMDGNAVLGEFDGADQRGDEGAPMVRITGTAVLGEVELEQRHAGESGWHAFWRRRRERKQKRIRERRERRRLPRGD